jgi:NDP-sugar pyrophosphorylase family protein
MIPALVLGAGLGTRLDPLTRLRAKPAMPLGDYTLIERVLAHLRRDGVRDVVVNLHHRPASITGVVADGATLGLSVRYSWEREILGSAGGPRRALGLLDAEEFLIVNGDTLCEVPLAALMAAHEASGADVTLAVVPNPAPDFYNGIRADEHDVVRGFVPKGQAAGSWHFVGVQIAAASVFASLPDGVPTETVSGLYRAMVGATPGRVCIFPVTNPFVDVGTPRDYLEAARALATTTTTDTLADCLVWPGIQVAAGSSLRRCIVATDVTTPVSATEAVLVPANAVRATDRVTRHGDVAVFPFVGLP